MSGPFATYFGNGRLSSVPMTPTVCEFIEFTGTTTSSSKIAVSLNNASTGIVPFYLYYASLSMKMSALAMVQAVIQVQFLNAALAVVSGPTSVYVMSASINNATGVLADDVFYPSFPLKVIFTGLPNTIAWAQVKVAINASVGAFDCFANLGYGIDTTNTGAPGDIGGGGVAAQSSTNPNAF